MFFSKKDIENARARYNQLHPVKDIPKKAVNIGEALEDKYKDRANKSLKAYKGLI